MYIYILHTCEYIINVYIYTYIYINVYINVYVY